MNPVAPWPAGSLRIEALGQGHDRGAFACGVDPLDRYIRQQASQDMRRVTARVFVAVSAEHPDRILGYYTLSAATIAAGDLPSDVTKRLPRYPVPAALVGRLAVDRTAARRGLGSLLLADAVKKTMLAAQTVAMTVIAVDPIDDAARRFYEAFGFRSLLGPERRMFLSLPPSNNPGPEG